MAVMEIPWVGALTQTLTCCLSGRILLLLCAQGSLFMKVASLFLPLPLTFGRVGWWSSLLKRQPYFPSPRTNMPTLALSRIEQECFALRFQTHLSLPLAWPWQVHGHQDLELSLLSTWISLSLYPHVDMQIFGCWFFGFFWRGEGLGFLWGFFWGGGLEYFFYLHIAALSFRSQPSSLQRELPRTSFPALLLLLLPPGTLHSIVLLYLCLWISPSLNPFICPFVH